MFMTPLSSTQIETYNAKGGSTATSTDPQAAQDRFLKLFVAQLNNQDPLNPMENAEMTSQMAQINTVTGINQVNETLKTMAQQFSSGQALQGASLIGRTALIEGNQPVVQDGTAYGGFQLDASAQSVRVDIIGKAGQLLGSTSMADVQAGQQFFEIPLDGVDSSQVASFQVTAQNGSQPVSATSISLAPVASVGMQSGSITLTSSTGKTFAYDKVLGYR